MILVGLLVADEDDGEVDVDVAFSAGFAVLAVSGK
jgi:hypothetical protein